MKFAKELQRDLVPEWQSKYLDYKGGKKHVKNVARAIARAQSRGALTPTITRRSGELLPHPTPSFSARRKPSRRPTVDSQAGGRGLAVARTRSHAAGPSKSPAKDVPDRRDDGDDAGVGEKQRLKKSPSNNLQYGSFSATPPAMSTSNDPGDPLQQVPTYQRDFALPDPAMKVPSRNDEAPKKPTLRNPFHRSQSMQTPQGRESIEGSPKQQPNKARHARTFTPGDGNGSDTTSKQGSRRMFSSNSRPTLTRKQSNFSPNEYQRDADELEDKFFAFLDSELDKVDGFYREKEDEAGKRLAALREQLHVMRTLRLNEIESIRARRRVATTDSSTDNPHGEESDGSAPKKPSHNGDSWLQHGLLQPARARLLDLGIARPGPNSKALQKMPQTPHMSGGAGAGHEEDAAARRDYTRRPSADDVPYRTAKHKLKLALQEFYRGLELLKSYALLNRTAFRKLNKKYDKAVNARPQYRYMHERVNESYFVRSTALDAHISAVEDLYARYFERGNHKLAAGKLRSLTRRPADESASAFRSGILIGTGLVFAVQGCTYGAELLFDEDPTVRGHTIYLMQVYAGYFLMLYLFVLFCLDCRLWTRSKINYQFIFELDPRSQLDWRQLAQFPAFFLLVFGVFMWINFTRLGSHEMYLYFPVMLIGVTLLVLFFPAPVFYWRSRRWFIYSHWRLLLAGVYPVEFRDFFLGDIYCSLTYAMCNIELFFCLYYNRWEEPEQCNSSHSRLLGFFSALPPIWRFLQCIRRYYDTRNAFPHLVNCGKYSMSIMAAVCLSVYRIENTHANLALFITFSTVNAIYCSIWDIFMDFSLLQPTDSSKNNNFLLRDILGLKKKWPYYVVMVVDPILRFSWIFYAIFTHDAQHSTIVSFMAAFAEVSRRGMWTIFRVENEHCANVAQYKASRDVPLPYRLETTVSSGQDGGTSTAVEGDDGDGNGSVRERRGQTAAVEVHEVGLGLSMSRASAAEEGRGGQGNGTVRRRMTRADTLVGGLSKLMAEAHKQDFEKRRKPPIGAGGSPAVHDAEGLYHIQHAAAVADDDDSEDMEGGGAFSNDEADGEDEGSDGEDSDTEERSSDGHHQEGNGNTGEMIEVEEGGGGRAEAGGSRS